MRWALALTLVLATCTALCQVPTPPPAPSLPESLPDSPGSTRQQQLQAQQEVVVLAEASYAANGTAQPPCAVSNWRHTKKDANPKDEESRQYCIDTLNPYTRFLDTTMLIPMTSRQKGYLAFHNLTDPFNLATIVATSAFTIGIDAHSAYGPGWKGFGKNAGLSFSQDAMGEFFGTWLIPSITHEDPHYHRMPNASVPRRTLHALSRTIIAQHDDSSPMPNYATLLTYPIVATLSNFYVPGIDNSAEATVRRIVTGLAIDPADNLIAEFLPDVAKHVHIRVIFVQRILNRVASGEQGTF